MCRVSSRQLSTYDIVQDGNHCKIKVMLMNPTLPKIVYNWYDMSLHLPNPTITSLKESKKRKWDYKS
jgi:hypothetical protein